jgi:hypothetical protein
MRIASTINIDNSTYHTIKLPDNSLSFPIPEDAINRMASAYVFNSSLEVDTGTDKTPSLMECLTNAVLLHSCDCGSTHTNSCTALGLAQPDPTFTSVLAHSFNIQYNLLSNPITPHPSIPFWSSTSSMDLLLGADDTLGNFTFEGRYVLAFIHPILLNSNPSLSTLIVNSAKAATLNSTSPTRCIIILPASDPILLNHSDTLIATVRRDTLMLNPPMVWLNSEAPHRPTILEDMNIHVIQNMEARVMDHINIPRFLDKLNFPTDRKDYDPPTLITPDNHSRKRPRLVLHNSGNNKRMCKAPSSQDTKRNSKRKHCAIPHMVPPNDGNYFLQWCSTTPSYRLSLIDGHEPEDNIENLCKLTGIIPNSFMNYSNFPPHRHLHVNRTHRSLITTNRLNALAAIYRTKKARLSFLNFNFDTG